MDDLMSQLNDVAAMEAAACQTDDDAMDLQCQELLHALEQASATACAGEGEDLDPAVVLGAVAGSARLTETARLAELGCGQHARAVDVAEAVYRGLLEVLEQCSSRLAGMGAEGEAQVQQLQAQQAGLAKEVRGGGKEGEACRYTWPQLLNLVRRGTPHAGHSHAFQWRPTLQ